MSSRPEVNETELLSEEDVKLFTAKGKDWPKAQCEKLRVYYSHKDSNYNRAYYGVFPTLKWICWKGDKIPNWFEWDHRDRNPFPNASSNVSVKPPTTMVAYNADIRELQTKVDKVIMTVDANVDGLTVAMDQRVEEIKTLQGQVDYLLSKVQIWEAEREEAMVNPKKQKATSEIHEEEDRSGHSLPRFTKKQKK